jgi:hypothetical protein
LTWIDINYTAANPAQNELETAHTAAYFQKSPLRQ